MAKQTLFVNQAFPTEILKKILERLDIKSLCSAKQTCKHWKNIIDTFKLLENASSKYLELKWFTIFKSYLQKLVKEIKKLRFCSPLNHAQNLGKRKNFWKCKKSGNFLCAKHVLCIQ